MIREPPRQLPLMRRLSCPSCGRHIGTVEYDVARFEPPPCPCGLIITVTTRPGLSEAPPAVLPRL